MIKLIVMGIILSGFYGVAFGDELGEAYQREYAYLKAQKSELQRRLAQEKSDQLRMQKQAKKKVEALQAKLLNLNTTVNSFSERLGRLQENLENIEDNSEISNGVLMQMNSTMAPYGYQPPESGDLTGAQMLQNGFQFARHLLERLSSMSVEPGSFFLPDGGKVDGDIVSLGNIARYGVSAEGSGALAPAGGGEFRLWPAAEASQTATTLASGETPGNLNILIYENPEKEISDPETKTIKSTVESGGIVAYIILGLGALGLLLILLRVLFLARAGFNTNRIPALIVDQFDHCKANEAMGAIKKYRGPMARVMRAILRNLKYDRDHLEDIIAESILNESVSLDRFGSFVLVIAAVAPLLGLLGTVAGMISTFDVITQYGTGDPKMLSGGISVALVTTMLGLIVAIPLLLLGNLLSGWARNVKDAMERNALHVVNQFEISKAKCSKV